MVKGMPVTALTPVSGSLTSTRETSTLLAENSCASPKGLAEGVTVVVTERVADLDDRLEAEGTREALEAPEADAVTVADPEADTVVLEDAEAVAVAVAV